MQVTEHIGGFHSDLHAVLNEGTIQWPVRCDIVSAPTSEGVVQLSPQGPMILLRDRGTIGGYARGWVVIAEDLDLAAQLSPGEAVQFELVTWQQARDMTM